MNIKKANEKWLKSPSESSMKRKPNPLGKWKLTMGRSPTSVKEQIKRRNACSKYDPNVIGIRSSLTQGMNGMGGGG